MKEIKLIELFSGIGGFTKGLQEAGFDITKHYFSEIDKHAIANYKYNFKNAEYIGSVTDVRGTRGQADIITFGSPCQDFSLAGKRKGMEGQRSSLILEAIRLISEIQPSVFIWENVKGTFSSNDGADFWAILNAFTDIGNYRLEWQLLNTSWFLPQNRERIYLIGHLAGRSETGVFPFTEANTRIIKGQSKTPIVRAITAGGNSGGHHSGMTLVKQLNDKGNFNGNSTKQQDRVYDTSGLMACLGSHRLESKVNILVKPVLTPDRLEKRQNGRRFKEDGEPSFTLSCQDRHGVMITTNTKQGFDVMTDEDSLNLSVPTSKTRRGRVGKGVAQTLDTQCNQGVLEKTEIRRLTEIECERLQGFPDNWTKYGNYDGEVKEIAKTQRYKMCGNAVTTKVVKAIGERLKISKAKADKK